MYGQGIVTAPILFAMEELPQLREIVEQGFDDPSSNVDVVCIESVPFSFFLVKLCANNLGFEMFISWLVWSQTCSFYTLIGPQIPSEKSRNREDEVTGC